MAKSVTAILVLVVVLGMLIGCGWSSDFATDETFNEWYETGYVDYTKRWTFRVDEGRIQADILTYRANAGRLDHAVSLTVECEEGGWYVGIHTDMPSDFGGGVTHTVTVQFDETEPYDDLWVYYDWGQSAGHYRRSINASDHDTFVENLQAAKKLVLKIPVTETTIATATWADVSDFPRVFEKLQKECEKVGRGVYS